MQTLKGLYVALVTPFKNGKVDEAGLRANIDFVLENGASGVVPCGTTGESATLSWQEHKDVVSLAVDHVKDRAQVIAGAGSNNTLEAVEAAKHAKESGANAALMITPYYNKPTQEGLYRHYERVTGEIDIPIVVYNVPGRTGVNLLPATLERLCKLPGIVGVKEASGSIDQICEIKHRCGDDLVILSGDDAMTLPILSIGGTGVISVVGNVAPREMADMIDAWHSGDVARARELHFRLFDLCNAMFLETNPIPAKTAMAMMGMPSGDFRLPLVPMSEGTRGQLAQVMKDFGLKV